MPKILCTMTMAHLVDENLPSKSLKYLAEHILKVPKDEIQEYKDVDKENYHEFANYAIRDAVWTWDLYRVFEKQIVAQNLSHLLWDIEMPFQRALMWLRIHGMKVDVSTARTMTYETKHLLYKIENEMYNMVYPGGSGNWYFIITPRSRKVELKRVINFSSEAQMIPIIEGLGIKIYEKTNKGNKSIGKVFKNRIKGQYPLLDLWMKYIKVEKLLSGFLEPLEGFIDEDGRIRCSFHNTVAVTGRLSCSNPNLEQLPKNNDIANIRNLFISSTDSVYIVADYSGQELRVLGEETQDPALKKAFADGKDLHQAVADGMGISRDEAKTVNFGIPYGKGSYGFSKDFNCSEKEAQEYLDKYFAKYPRVKTRIERCKLGVYKNGYVVNMSGRKRRFPNFHKLNVWKQKRCYRQAFNFIIQSYGADVVKVAAAEIVKDINLRLVNIIHDEVVIECLKNYVDTAIPYITKCMIEAIPMSIPWEVTVGQGERYGEAK